MPIFFLKISSQGREKEEKLEILRRRLGGVLRFGVDQPRSQEKIFGSLTRLKPWAREGKGGRGVAIFKP